jgi:hypothetical protein
MLFRPKRINKGFDRIFLVMAIIAGISFGYAAFNSRVINPGTENSIYNYHLKLGQAPYLPSYPTGKGITDEEYERQVKDYEKKKAWVQEKLRERKRQLESQGYQVDFMAMSYGRHENKLVPTDDDSDPNLYEIWIYPTISHRLVAGSLSAGISFLIGFFSFRGLALLVLWIKQGFSEKG